MKFLLSQTMRDIRGIAALEFALIVPLLLTVLGGMTDFAQVFWYQGVLAASVEEGAEYAYLIGTNVAKSSVQNVVGQKLALPASAVTVTGPSCYCVSGTPATAASQACNQVCPNGISPNTYLSISAQYTYRSILPIYSGLVNPQLTETTMVRLK